MEDAVRRVVVGAERLPVVRADRPPGERHLVEVAAGDGDADLGAVVDRARRVRRAEDRRRRGSWSSERSARLPHDRRQRRHGDGDPALAVALDLRGRRPARRP